MRTPLDDVSFVTRSVHRVAMLEALTPDGCTRRDLGERTGISQATIGRILNDFEERGWVKRSPRTHTHALTPFGALLCEELTSLLGTVETMQRLENVIEWLPADDFDFQVNRFADADIVLPKPNDSFPQSRSVGIRIT